MLSIIIPAFNAEKTLPGLLDSIYCSDFKDYEVIVVDDFSSDRTADIIKSYPARGIFLDTTTGPAVARNKGARVAGAQILVFLDADVMLEPDTLGKIARRFQENRDIKILVGTYSEMPLNKGFFPKFKALWFKSLFNENVKETDSLEGFCAAIDREVFKSTGGFNPLFQKAGMEDYELGCRLRQRYQIYFDANIQVRHNFPGFLKNGVRFFRRAYNFAPLFLKQEKNCRAHYLDRDALASISSFVSFLSLPFMVLHSIYATFLFLILITAFIFFSQRFIKLVFNRKGLLFTLIAIITYYINSIILGFAMALGVLRYLLVFK